MEYSGNDYFTAKIPGFPADTRISYLVSSGIFNGIPDDPYYQTSLSDTLSYEITPLSERKVLVIFNGFENTAGYPQNYYFMGLDESIYNSFHKIAGEPLTSEMAENYENIFEIFAKDYAFDNKDVIREWLKGSGSRNYFLCGQYFIKSGTESGDSLYNYGDFEYDLLGLVAGRMDINSYLEETDSATTIIPMADTELGGSMYDHAESEEQNTIEYRFGLNGIDAVVPSPENEVSFRALGKDGEDYIVGTSRLLDEGNKIAFLTYDPVMLYSSPDDYWYGRSGYSPVIQAYHWFNRVPTDVEAEEIVYNFSLSQNYPNPFNPSTLIEYSLPSVERNSVSLKSNKQFGESLYNVTLKVYDILGREIATLVDNNQPPGNYRVNFDAYKYRLASGIYFYSLHAGNFSQAKKMLLLK
jgi:hypothetical protein